LAAFFLFCVFGRAKRVQKHIELFDDVLAWDYNPALAAVKADYDPPEALITIPR
jgi:hypothetical protein